MDKDKESYYWRQIREKSERLNELRAKPMPAVSVAIPDYTGLRDFLMTLPEKWPTFSQGSA